MAVLIEVTISPSEKVMLHWIVIPLNKKETFRNIKELPSVTISLVVRLSDSSDLPSSIHLIPRISFKTVRHSNPIFLPTEENVLPTGDTITINMVIIVNMLAQFYTADNTAKQYSIAALLSQV